VHPEMTGFRWDTNSNTSYVFYIRFVSRFPPIHRKRETKGNEIGNGQETKKHFPS
jgi:hypothetical protein